MIRINLLPVREERRKADVRQWAILMAATLVGAIVLCALFHLKVHSDIAAARTQLTETQRQIDGFKAQVV